MNILILGSGGREHTFAYKLSQSNRCKNLFVAPGNAGTSETATNVSICALEKRVNIFIYFSASSSEQFNQNW